MKKLMALVLVLVFILSFAGCNNISLPEQVLEASDTSVRIGKSGSKKASFDKSYSFKEAYSEADLVAEVVITEWLGELDKDGYNKTTYFKATITENFKNELNYQENEITLLQSGNSNWTFKGYPLFKNGDKFLLFLSWMDPTKYPEYCSNKEDCFAIVGEQLTEMQVVDKDGEKYALKRNLYNNFTDIEHLAKPNATKIIESALKQDEVLLAAGTKFESVYLVDDLKNHMESFKNADN